MGRFRRNQEALFWLIAMIAAPLGVLFSNLKNPLLRDGLVAATLILCLGSFLCMMVARNSRLEGYYAGRQHAPEQTLSPSAEEERLIRNDQIVQEYQSVWFDNMTTGMMVGKGAFDGASQTLTDQGEFSCPMTMETHRSFRSAWKIVDADHTIYESYMKMSDGREFKAMEIRYSRVQ